MIRPECIARIRQISDIVYIINELVALEKAGSNYKACCPFHTEKSASFNVNQTRQIYKCFGCGAYGDVFAFVKEFKRLTFSEAVIYVASRYNEPVEYEPRDPKPRTRFDNLKL